MCKANKAKVKNLLERGTFKTILKKDVYLDFNVLSDRYLLTIKSTSDVQVKCMARYKFKGTGSEFEDIVVSSPPT